MSESGAEEVSANTLTIEHLLFIDGIRAMSRAGARVRLVTANTTAHLTDEAGRCTLESRAKAEKLLGELLAWGEIEIGACYFVGGDRHQAYVLPQLTQPAREILVPGI